MPLPHKVEGEHKCKSSRQRLPLSYKWNQNFKVFSSESLLPGCRRKSSWSVHPKVKWKIVKESFSTFLNLKSEIHFFNTLLIYTHVPEKPKLKLNCIRAEEQKFPANPKVKWCLIHCLNKVTNPYPDSARKLKRAVITRYEEGSWQLILFIHTFIHNNLSNLSYATFHAYLILI